ncbi:hypothetical protein L596_022282 [Steinernema carpocapsae]|uniref:Peptidase A1 domain-containing protein n=1 Tax=Steinernema carpocapsae TaxID=34508 RepID=A0A4U5MM41_STECR|nr:hypothetical protein L596_022282 [Steinernema carpocapsae]
MKVLMLLALLGVAAAAIHQIQLQRVESRRERMMREGTWERFHKQKEFLRMMTTKFAKVGQVVNDYTDTQYIGNITIDPTPKSLPSSSTLDLPTCGSLTLPAEAEPAPTVLTTAPTENSASFSATPRAAEPSPQSSPAPAPPSASSTPPSRPRTRRTDSSGPSSTELDPHRDSSEKTRSALEMLVPTSSAFPRPPSARPPPSPPSSPTTPLTVSSDLASRASPSTELFPPLINANNQGLLDKPVFTVWMEEKGQVNNVNGGLYTYGGIDTANCGSHISYVPLSSATYWQFTMSGVRRILLQQPGMGSHLRHRNLSHRRTQRRSRRYRSSHRSPKRWTGKLQHQVFRKPRHCSHHWRQPVRPQGAQLPSRRRNQLPARFLRTRQRWIRTRLDPRRPLHPPVLPDL